jgi:hypothetical protein
MDATNSGIQPSHKHGAHDHVAMKALFNMNLNKKDSDRKGQIINKLIVNLYSDDISPQLYEELKNSWQNILDQFKHGDVSSAIKFLKSTKKYLQVEDLSHNIELVREILAEWQTPV